MSERLGHQPESQVAGAACAERKGCSVDLKKITDAVKGAVEDVKDKAGELVESRGGLDGIKEDLKEVKDIATGEGSLKDKAKAAVEAVKDPGAPGEQ